MRTALVPGHHAENSGYADDRHTGLPEGRVVSLQAWAVAVLLVSSLRFLCGLRWQRLASAVHPVSGDAARVARLCLHLSILELPVLGALEEIRVTIYPADHIIDLRRQPLP